MSDFRLFASVLALLALPSSARAAWLEGAEVIRRDGVVRMAVGLKGQSLASPTEAAARAWLGERGGELGLAGQQLGPARMVRTRLGSVLQVPLFVRGLPVVDARVTVAVDAKGRVRRVGSSAWPVRSVEMVRALDGRQAMAVAARALDGVVLREGKPAGGFREVAVVRDGVARLAYEVHVDALDPRKNWYALVDAQSGEVLRWQNRVFFADTARAYLSNPGAAEQVPLSEVTLEHFANPRDGDGKLVGELIDAYSCCVHVGCDTAQPAKLLAGTVSYPGIPFPIAFETPFCDFQQQASNVLNGRTDYDYGTPPPLDYDVPIQPVGQDPADQDPFAEVHVFYHANVAYQFFRSVGDPAFVLRDGRDTPPKRPWVVANMVFPDYDQSHWQWVGGKVVIPGLVRVDNSMFVPREEFAALLPGLPTGSLPSVDTLMMFQGPHADFALDGDVVYHEFTHGVIFSTANFNGPHLDAYGALDEAGTMHEALADYFAAAITRDPKLAEYVGAKMPVDPGKAPEGELRDLENTKSCPTLLVGEVHNDSQHFSAAAWSARKKFLGTDGGRTFDGAMFDALVSLTPASGFNEAVAAFADAAAAAFPSVGTARDDVLAEFRARGVVDCVKVVEYTGPRPWYAIQGCSAGFNPIAPGPVQLKVKAPSGAMAVTVHARATPAGLSLVQAPTVTVSALVNVNKAITFSGSPAAVVHDAQWSHALGYNSNARTVDATFPIVASPGDDIYLTLANTGQDAVDLEDIAVSLTPAPGPDAGPDAAAPGPDAAPPGPDAQEPGPDAGLVAAADAGQGAVEDDGCGCGAGSSVPLLGASVLFVALLRRRRV
jgi:hypothetical protein